MSKVQCPDTHWLVPPLPLLKPSKGQLPHEYTQHKDVNSHKTTYI